MSNRIRHGQFVPRIAPNPNVATTTVGRYVDGTATGSSTEVATGWYFNGGGSNKSAQIVENADSDNNNHAIKLSVEGGASYVTASLVNNNQTFTDYREEKAVKVKPNTTYVLKYRHMRVYRGGDSTRGSEIEVRLIDTDSATTTKKTGVKKDSQHWTDETYEFTTSGDTAFVELKLVIYGHEGGADLDMDAYWSNFRLYEKTPAQRSLV